MEYSAPLFLALTDDEKKKKSIKIKYWYMNTFHGTTECTLSLYTNAEHGMALKTCDKINKFQEKCR